MADKKLEPVTIAVQDVQSSTKPAAPAEENDRKPVTASSSGLLTVRKELLDAVVVHQAQRISELERMLEKKRAKIEQLSTSQPFLHPSQPFVVPPTNPATAAAAAQTTIPTPPHAGGAQTKAGTMRAAPQQAQPPGPVPHNPMVPPNPLIPPNPLAQPNPVMAAAMAAVAATGHPQGSAPLPLQYPFVYPPPDHPALAAGLMGMMPTQVPMPPAQTVQRPVSSQPAQSSDGNDRKQSRYWTEDEHQRYLAAVSTCGPKNYEQISEIVGTRNAKQVRTHAQKFQKKLEREEAKRRNSMRLAGAPHLPTSVGAAAAAAVAAAAAAAIHSGVPGAGPGNVTNTDCKSARGPTSSSSGKNFERADREESRRASPSVDGSSSTNDASREKVPASQGDAPDVLDTSNAAAAAAAIAAEAANLGNSVLRNEGIPAVLMHPSLKASMALEQKKLNSARTNLKREQETGKPLATSQTSADEVTGDISTETMLRDPAETNDPAKQSSQVTFTARDANPVARVDAAREATKKVNTPAERGTGQAGKGSRESSISSRAKQEPLETTPKQVQHTPSPQHAAASTDRKRVESTQQRPSRQSAAAGSSSEALPPRGAASMSSGILNSKPDKSQKPLPAALGNPVARPKPSSALAQRPPIRTSATLSSKGGHAPHTPRKSSAVAESTHEDKRVGSIGSNANGTSNAAKPSVVPSVATRIAPKPHSGISTRGTGSATTALNPAAQVSGTNRPSTNETAAVKKPRFVTSGQMPEAGTAAPNPLKSKNPGTRTVRTQYSSNNLTEKKTASAVSKGADPGEASLSENGGTDAILENSPDGISDAAKPSPKHLDLSTNGRKDEVDKMMVTVTDIKTTGLPTESAQRAETLESRQTVDLEGSRCGKLVDVRSKKLSEVPRITERKSENATGQDPSIGGSEAPTDPQNRRPEPNNENRIPSEADQLKSSSPVPAMDNRESGQSSQMKMCVEDDVPRTTKAASGGGSEGAHDNQAEVETSNTGSKRDGESNSGITLPLDGRKKGSQAEKRNGGGFEKSTSGSRKRKGEIGEEGEGAKRAKVNHINGEEDDVKEV